MDVAVFGDSLMGQSGDYVGWFLGIRGHHRTDTFYWGGTNWCDWRHQAIHHGRPAVIAAFSGNMITPCTQGRGTTEDVFRADCDEFAAIQAYLGRQTWLCSTPGPVGTREADNWVRPILAQTAAKYAGVTYVDAASVLAVNGTYPLWVPCTPTDVQLGHCYRGLAVLRDDDQRHLRPAGARRWGQRIAEALPAA